MRRNNDVGEEVLGCVGTLVILIGYVLLAVMVSGYTTSLMWNWFIVPKFGLPSLTVVEALLLGSVVGVQVSYFRDYLPVLDAVIAKLWYNCTKRRM